MTYALGSVGVLALLIALVLISTLQHRPAPAPSPMPTIPPVQVEEISVIPHEPAHLGDKRTIDLVARLRNPNPRLGVTDYPVMFNLKAANGQAPDPVTVTTYLLPGAVQYVTAMDVPVTQPIDGAEVKLPADPTYVQLPENVSVPTFNTFPRERQSRQIGTVSVEEQKGIVRNTSPFAWSKVEVIGVAMDAAGAIVGVGQTFVGALEIGEQREFFLQWPTPVTATERVILIPSTNIFREENLQPLIGNPDTLR